MRRNKNNPKCPNPECQDPENVKKHAIRNGIQCYYCNGCKKAFQLTKKRVKYSASEKTLLSILVSVLQTEKGKDIKDMLKNVKNISEHIGEYRLIEREIPDYGEISCFSPRLLVGQSGNNITLYKITPENWKSKKRYFKDTRLRYDI